MSNYHAVEDYHINNNFPGLLAQRFWFMRSNGWIRLNSMVAQPMPQPDAGSCHAVEHITVSRNFISWTKLGRRRPQPGSPRFSTRRRSRSWRRARQRRGRAGGAPAGRCRCAGGAGTAWSETCWPARRGRSPRPALAGRGTAAWFSSMPKIINIS